MSVNRRQGQLASRLWPGKELPGNNHPSLHFHLVLVPNDCELREHEERKLGKEKNDNFMTLCFLESKSQGIRVLSVNESSCHSLIPVSLGDRILFRERSRNWWNINVPFLSRLHSFPLGRVGNKGLDTYYAEQQLVLPSFWIVELLPETSPLFLGQERGMESC